MTNFTPKQINEIAKNMKAYGGSFMRNIGAALEVADQENTKKILSSWNEEAKQYLKYSNI